MNLKAFLLIIVSIVTFPKMVISQSGFEDASGKSSVILYDGGAGRINLTDATIRIGYLYKKSSEPVRFGFSLSGKNADGFASIIKKGVVTPEANATVCLGWQWLLSHRPVGKPPQGIIVDDWLTFEIGYKRAVYKLFYPDNLLDNQIEKKKFNGLSIKSYYNLLIKGNILIGISIGCERQNNYRDLEQVEIADTLFTYNNSAVSRSVNQVKNARYGDYAESNHFVSNWDLIWMPEFLGNRIGIDFFGRIDIAASNRMLLPGIGIFLSEKGSPTKIIGGVSLSINENKLNIGLVAGYNF